ncbi:site-specific integrase [Bacteroides sp. 224]|uniref:site-specific integrase n=1 Tax=Bacteroides sp. 224 TaxID=2302936 RepID=UPI0013D5B3C6|nr:site-specific integrase [Bacteroides sp. 224]NDV66923.1 hypothetical protein [Bacteroides sp. 224]
MKIKRTVSTFIQKQYSGTEEYSIRTSVRWKRENSGTYEFVAFNVGHAILPKQWNTDTARVKKNCVNQKMISAVEINKAIQNLEDIIDATFKKYEVNEHIPDKTEFRNDVNLALGKKAGKNSELKLVQDAFGMYILDLANRKTLAEATFMKLRTIKNILKDFDPELKLSDITADKLDIYVDYLIHERDMRNTTIKKNLSFIRGFLHYCDDRNLIKTDWKTHIVELRIIRGKNIIFLDLDEFERVYNFQFPENKKYLDKTRDIFCFQCLTSLRYSDVKKLMKIDIAENHINPIVTKKTGAYINIPLNKKAKEILKKYAHIESDYALPVPSNQKMNDYLKEICYLVGISELITLHYYKGKELVTEIVPKYEEIATHTARRSFICIALANGISPEVIMRITGHSDYKAMLPYIDVTSERKVEAVSVFD